MTKRVITTALFLLCQACVVYHRPSMETEREWLSSPPKIIQAEGAVAPSPIDADMVYFSPGVFGSTGVVKPAAQERTFNANIGFEYTLGWAKTSYRPHMLEHGVLKAPSVDTGVALKLGWTAFEREGGFSGPLYVETVLGKGPRPGLLLSMGLGWITDLDEGDHGFLISGYLGPFYLRLQKLVHGRTEFLFGLRVEFPIIFIFDR